MTDANRTAETDEDESLLSLKAYLRANKSLLRDDLALLTDLGLRLDAANIVDFGPVALSKVTAARQRESSERRRLEAVSRANFAAQAQTHASVIDLLDAGGHADLATRIDQLARRRFGLACGVIALEGPGAAPDGWRALAPGQVDLILGRGKAALMGHAPTAYGLFGDRAGEIGSIAVLRLALWSPRRQGVLAFGAADGAAFTPDMGPDLVAFLARVTERMAERWPPE